MIDQKAFMDLMEKLDAPRIVAAEYYFFFALTLLRLGVILYDDIEHMSPLAENLFGKTAMYLLKDSVGEKHAKRLARWREDENV